MNGMAGRRDTDVRSTRWCIFCGGHSLTKEHIWPQWCEPLFPRPGREGARLTINMKSIGTGPLLTSPSYRKRPGSVRGMRLRVVCAPCNNTWMSRLEADAQPILTPLIQGRLSTLDANQQRTVAEWMALKLMVADHGHPDDYVVSETDRYDFRKSRRIPDGFEVRLGRCGQGRWTSCFFRVTALRERPKPVQKDLPPKNLESVVFGIGALLIFAFVSPDPELTTSDSLSKPLPRLWPPQATELLWPPEIALSADQADNVAHSLEQLLNYPGIGRLPLWRL